MQAYGEGFARMYNARWAGFSRQVAPLLMNFYASTPIGSKNKSVLDLCCGCGHLAVHLLENGYRVVGIDLSEHMLFYARENAGRFIESGQARFVQGDAGDFALKERFGLAVAMYDALNHLGDEEALGNCFRCVHAVTEGYFIFDLNTRGGLRRWNAIQMTDNGGEDLLISRGFFDGESDRAWMRFTGFLGTGDGLFQRFDETVYNTVFSLERVREMLLEVGWRDIRFARIGDLSTPLAEPEEEGRVFVVAGR